jgi:hypothetical protein
MRSPFDAALENHELHAARSRYALSHGAPRTDAHLAAWLRFSRHIRTIDDLGQARRARARHPRQNLDLVDAVVMSQTALAARARRR